MPHALRLVDLPPERACAVMAAALDALSRDIVAARRRTRRPRPPRYPRGAAPDGERVALSRRDAVVIRPIRADDARRLQSMFARLGALTRYRRFLSPLTHLTTHQLAYLMHVDHEALVALEPRSGEILGVARYLRDPANPSRARLTVAVVDDWQGRGVGGALVERLSVRARANSVEVFGSSTVAGNQAARRLMRHDSVTLADEWSAGMSELTGRLAQPRSTAAPCVAPWPATAGP